MVVGTVQAAKRALVKLLLALALTYSVTLKITRESSDRDVTAAFKRVALRAHPDKAGSTTDTQRLVGAKDAWTQRS